MPQNTSSNLIWAEDRRVYTAVSNRKHTTAPPAARLFTEDTSEVLCEVTHQRVDERIRYAINMSYRPPQHAVSGLLAGIRTHE